MDSSPFAMKYSRGGFFFQVGKRELAVKFRLSRLARDREEDIAYHILDVISQSRCE